MVRGGSPADSVALAHELRWFLGHRDSEMIRHYYHMQQDEARKQMNKLPSLDPSGSTTSSDGKTDS